jgi:hypothetical protein
MQRLDNNLATLKIVYDVVTLKTTMIIPYAAETLKTSSNPATIHLVAHKNSLTHSK